MSDYENELDARHGFGIAEPNEKREVAQPKRDSRGLMEMSLSDTRGCRCRIKRSSAAEQDCVWIFCDDTHNVYQGNQPHPHLNAQQAREVAKALLCFAEGDDLNDPDLNKEGAEQ